VSGKHLIKFVLVKTSEWNITFISQVSITASRSTQYRICNTSDCIR